MRTLPSAVRDAQWIDLAEGQSVTGTVVRLPARGIPSGTRLFIRTDSDVVSIAAAAKRGWSVFERELKRQNVQAGDRIKVTFVGWRQTTNEERRYRNVDVTVLNRQARLNQPVRRAA